ncbi:MAG: M16 family metallopeptidase [Myxococcota bacterium]
MAKANGGAPTPDLASLNRRRPETARVEKVADQRRGPALIEKFRLGNGLRVIVWEDHRAPVFSFHTWFGVGSRHERIGRTGMAHLFEHLLFKATKNLPEGEFDRIMERHGAQTNAATWVDWTYYRAKLPAGNLELVCRLEADRMENMILDDHQLESEREVVVNERLLRVDNDPDGRLFEELYALAFRKHPYRWPTIGWMEDIRAITLDDCLDFYRRFYAPNNATIVIVGDVDTGEALETIQRFYGHLEAQDIPREALPEEPPQTEERRKSLDLSITAEKGLFAWHAPSTDDPDQAALEILDEILTGGESSRLYKSLVTDLELASQLGGWAASWHDPGLYEIGIDMRPGAALADAERVLDETLDELMDSRVSERELAKARNGLEAIFLRGLAGTGNRARSLGDAETTAGDFRWLFRHVEALREVTADDVLRVARRVLPRSNRTVLIGRPAAAEGEGGDAS